MGFYCSIFLHCNDRRRIGNENFNANRRKSTGKRRLPVECRMMANEGDENSAGTRGGFRTYFRKQTTVLAVLVKGTQRKYRQSSQKTAGEFVVKGKTMCSKIWLLLNVMKWRPAGFCRKWWCEIRFNLHDNGSCALEFEPFKLYHQTESDYRRRCLHFEENTAIGFLC